MTEKYHPTAEEMNKAEDLMTDTQKEQSKKRVEIFERMKTDEGSFLDIQKAREMEIPETDIKEFVGRFIAADIRRGLGVEMALRIAKNSAVLTEEEVRNIATETYLKIFADNPADISAAEYLFGKESPEWQQAMWLAYDKQTDVQGEAGEAKDFANLKIIEEVLVRADPEELAALQEFHDLYPEQIELYVSYAQLRNKVHLQISHDLEERKANNPKATEEELAMGSYEEGLEHQVRKAVMKLRKKGYPTYESGFYGPPDNVQKIGFEDDCLVNFSLSQKIVDDFKKLGISIKLKNNSIELVCARVLDIEVLTNAWDEVADFLPDRGRPAEEMKLPVAEEFRVKQKKL